MNVLALYHDMKRRGERLPVNAPVGELTADDKGALAELKPLLLKILSRRGAPAEELHDDGRRFDVRPSHHPGYTTELLEERLAEIERRLGQAQERDQRKGA